MASSSRSYKEHTMGAHMKGKSYMPEELCSYPENHISHYIRNGLSYKTIQNCRGSALKVAEVWKKLDERITTKIEELGLYVFFNGVPGQRRTPNVIQAIRERWWDTTHTMHLPCGEVTMTPTDFHAITGLSFTNHPLEVDHTFSPTAAVMTKLIGFSVKVKGKGVPVSDLKKSLEVFLETTNLRHKANLDKATRGFLWWAFSETLFANHASTALFSLLSCLKYFQKVGDYSWGSAGLANCYDAMDEASRNVKENFCGYSPAWEVWGYAMFRLFHFDLYDPTARIPDSRRWMRENRKNNPMVFEDSDMSLETARQTLNDFNPRRIGQYPFYPWRDLGHLLDSAAEFTGTRMLMISLGGGCLYLGERVHPQHEQGSHHFIVPADPPLHMLTTDHIQGEDRDKLIAGESASEHMLPDASYRDFLPRLMGHFGFGERRPSRSVSSSSAPSSSSHLGGNHVPFYPRLGPPTYSWMLTDDFETEDALPTGVEIHSGLIPPPEATMVPIEQFNEVAGRLSAFIALTRRLKGDLIKFAGRSGQAVATPCTKRPRSEQGGDEHGEGGAGSLGVGAA